MLRHVLVIVAAALALGFSASSTAYAAGVGLDAAGSGGMSVDSQRQAEQEREGDNQSEARGKCADVPDVTGAPGDEIVRKGCDLATDVVDAGTGAVAEKVASGVLDQATDWMTNAATWVSGQIAAELRSDPPPHAGHGDAGPGAGTDRNNGETPELSQGWYRARFASMTVLAIGLAGLVAMIALGSAALRRDPEALAATVYGIVRAGVGTGLVIAVTVLALDVADEMSNAMTEGTIGERGGSFWSDVGSAWDSDNFAGFGDSAIAFLFALIQVLAGLVVWIEMLLRSAAIYIAVLFLPAALAASIWPPLRGWESRLIKVLFVLVAMKPVLVTVLLLSGSAGAAAITGEVRGDVSGQLSAIVILVLAACVPWALLTMVSLTAAGAPGARTVQGVVREAPSSAIGGSVGTARSVGSRMRATATLRSAAARSPSGSAVAGAGGSSASRTPAGSRSTPDSATSGSAPSSGAARVGTRAAAAGPVGTVAAAAGLGTYLTPPASTGEGVGRRGSTGHQPSAIQDRSRVAAARSTAPAPTAQRPGGGRPPGAAKTGKRDA